MYKTVALMLLVGAIQAGLLIALYGLRAANRLPQSDTLVWAGPLLLASLANMSLVAFGPQRRSLPRLPAYAAALLCPLAAQVAALAVCLNRWGS